MRADGNDYGEDPTMVPYSASRSARGDLVALAHWMETRLDSERFDRQVIAERALARIRDIIPAMR